MKYFTIVCRTDAILCGIKEHKRFKKSQREMKKETDTHTHAHTAPNKDGVSSDCVSRRATTKENRTTDFPINIHTPMKYHIGTDHI